MLFPIPAWVFRHRNAALGAAAGLFLCTGTLAAPEFTFQEIIIPDGTVVGVSDINNDGLISGTVYTGSEYLGYVYSFSAHTSAVYSADGWTSPGGLNDAGTTVGSRSQNSGATWSAFVRTADGTTEYPDHPLTSGANWDLWGINNAEDTVGTLWDASQSAWIGVIQTGGVYRTVTLGKPEEHLTGINDLGWFVGYYRDPVNHYDGCAWIFRPDGTLDAELMWDADHPLDNEMRAYDINNSNVVVGTVFRISDAINQGWIREPDGTVSAISYPGSLNTWVLGINDAGEIVGRYEDSEYQWHGFVGIPIPEPGTLALLWAGLATARIFRLRRRAAHGHDVQP